MSTLILWANVCSQWCDCTVAYLTHWWTVNPLYIFCSLTCYKITPPILLKLVDVLVTDRSPVFSSVCLLEYAGLLNHTLPLNCDAVTCGLTGPLHGAWSASPCRTVSHCTTVQWRSMKTTNLWGGWVRKWSVLFPLPLSPMLPAYTCWRRMRRTSRGLQAIVHVPSPVLGLCLGVSAPTIALVTWFN